MNVDKWMSNAVTTNPIAKHNLKNSLTARFHLLLKQSDNIFIFLNYEYGENSIFNISSVY